MARTTVVAIGEHDALGAVVDRLSDYKRPASGAAARPDHGDLARAQPDFRQCRTRPSVRARFHHKLARRHNLDDECAACRTAGDGRQPDPQR